MNRVAVLATLKQLCSGEFLEVVDGLKGALYVRIESGRLRDVIRALIEQHDMRHLSTITAQDRKEGVELLYHFWQDGGLTLRVFCPRESLALQSVVDLIPGADWYEREVHDMFGVDFVGHPNLSPLILPDDWDELPPMRGSGEER